MTTSRLPIDLNFEVSVSVFKSLEQASCGLELAAETRSNVYRDLMAYVETYLERVDQAPAYCEPPTASLTDVLPFSEKGHAMDQTLDVLDTFVDKPGIATTSPRFFGYVPGGGQFFAGVADMLAAITNKYASVSFASPGAVQVEDQCLSLLADVTGYPDSYGGYLSSGGSLANFTAIVTARDAMGIEGTAIATSVVYLTEHAHHCIDKALHLAGLSKCIVRRISVDAMYRMDVQALSDQLQLDIEQGLTPFFVVASAGTTNTGSIDPLFEIGHVTKQAGAWYHIDGAYGALFALCDIGKQKLQGMELSDSIVMDPHKTLFLPYGIGALLVKQKALLLASHAAGADYMQDVIHVQATSPATVSPELTKHFRGLRMWLPLQLLGVAPFRAALEEKMRLAAYFHDKLSRVPGFEVGPEPDLSIVTYRYVPQHHDPDEFNQQLVQAIHEDGRIFISSTRLNGRFMLRLAVVCFRTHKRDIDTALTVLQELALALDRP